MARFGIRFYVDRDVEKTHGARISIGGKRGIAFTIQWRSWEPGYVNPANPDAGVYDPLMLSISIFCWGTFLGATPFSDTWLGRRCCSNGVTPFHWTIIKPHTL